MGDWDCVGEKDGDAFGSGIDDPNAGNACGEVVGGLFCHFAKGLVGGDDFDGEFWGDGAWAVIGPVAWEALKGDEEEVGDGNPVAALAF